MAAISKIKIDGFKAFPKEFELILDGKNLLMYGENGSGKSSIYYALHALLQSQYHDKGAIYFDKNNSESLVNKDTTTADPYIEIELEGSNTKYHLSKNGYKELPAEAISPLRDMNAECVFINHKFLFNSFSFRNSQYIDLFPVFIKDILPLHLQMMVLNISVNFMIRLLLEFREKVKGQQLILNTIVLLRNLTMKF